MNGKMAWRKESIGLEAWQAKCRASSHVRPGDVVSFTVGVGVINCVIKDTAVFLGAYFANASERDGIVAGAGWCHE